MTVKILCFQEFKSSATTPKEVSEEMSRVVKLNVENVINFQQRLATSAK